MKYIELTHWGTGMNLDNVTFKTDMIEAILKPRNSDKTDRAGCIIVINGAKYPVEESYAEVCASLNTKNFE